MIEVAPRQAFSESKKISQLAIADKTFAYFTEYRAFYLQAE